MHVRYINENHFIARMDKKIKVKGKNIGLSTKNKEDYISLTDIAKYKNPKRSDDVIKNWIRNRSTLEFLGIWEQINNPDFNPVEFDGFRKQSGLNTFVMTPKQWIS